jgi:hypothetical protein
MGRSLAGTYPYRNMARRPPLTLVVDMTFLSLTRPRVRAFIAKRELYRERRSVSKLLKIIMVSMVLISSASTSMAQVAPVSVIRNDRGGSVAERLKMLEHLRRTGSKIEIRGTCASACTMLLALPNTCVAANARLHFHGPSSQYYGVALSPAEFEYWSRIMADHYPPSIRRWFMTTARHTIMGTIAITGTEAARLGVTACA